jgi:hypothetical protein
MKKGEDGKKGREVISIIDWLKRAAYHSRRKLDGAPFE